MKTNKVKKESEETNTSSKTPVVDKNEERFKKNKNAEVN